MSSRVSPVVSAAPRLAARAAAERRTRRQVWWRRVAIGLAVALPLALAGWLLLASSLFAVRDVQVVGESRLTARQVQDAAGIVRGTPLARVDTGAAAARVRRLPAVASVSVSRSWPHGVKVTVVERVPVVAVPHGASFQLLDPTGVQVQEVAAAPRGLYRLETASPEATTSALQVLRGLPRPLSSRLALLRASSPEQVTLVLRDGRQVLWGGAQDGAAKAAAALALLRMPGTVFDVSAPGVVTRR
jgi:cell division protein FtsQ